MKSHEYTNGRRMESIALPIDRAFQLLLILISVSFFSLQLSAQSIKVYTGKVVNEETGAGVPYATLSVPNSSRGTTTDEFGKFILMISDGDSKQVRVSSIGFESSQISLGSAVKDIKVSLVPVAYFLEEETIMSAEDILKKAFSDRSWLAEKPFWMRMMYSGSESVTLKKEFPYLVEAFMEFYYAASFKKIGLNVVLEKRNLANDDPGTTINYRRIPVGISRFHPPCELSDGKCWEKVQVNLERTTKYDGEKVWIISVLMPDAKKNKAQFARFTSVVRLEAEYVISTNTFAILREKTTAYYKTRPSNKIKKFNPSNPKYGYGYTLVPISHTRILNYRKHKGKYYLFHQKNMDNSKAVFYDEEKADVPLITFHEFKTISILTGPQYANPPSPKGRFVTWQINEVPYHAEFWEKIDQK